MADSDEGLIMLVTKLLHYFQTPWRRMPLSKMSANATACSAPVEHNPQLSTTSIPHPLFCPQPPPVHAGTAQAQLLLPEQLPPLQPLDPFCDSKWIEREAGLLLKLNKLMVDKGWCLCCLSIDC